MYMQKTELTPYTSPYSHISSRWIKDLNKVVKLGETGEKKLGI